MACLALLSLRSQAQLPLSCRPQAFVQDDVAYCCAMKPTMVFALLIVASSCSHSWPGMRPCCLDGTPHSLQQSSRSTSWITELTAVEFLPDPDTKGLKSKRNTCAVYPFHSIPVFCLSELPLSLRESSCLSTDLESLIGTM